MLEKPKRLDPTLKKDIKQDQSGSNQPSQKNTSYTKEDGSDVDITKEIRESILKCDVGLHQYPVRKLVEQTRKFGGHLKKHELKTNHLRRFLDAVKQINARLSRGDDFSVIDDDIAFLQPQLAYAAARKEKEMKRNDKINPAKDFSNVITTAIGKVKTPQDFIRLVQLIEATIAYHKEAGGE